MLSRANPFNFSYDIINGKLDLLVLILEKFFLQKLDFLMLTGQIVVLIDDLLQVIYLLVLILLLDITRNKMWLLIRVQRLNIGPWLILRLRCWGFVHYFVVWVSVCPHLWRYIVTTKHLYSLCAIQYFMRWLNTLKWIAILFEISWCVRRLKHHISNLVISWVTFLPNYQLCSNLCYKLGIFDLYALAWGDVRVLIADY